MIARFVLASLLWVAACGGDDGPSGTSCPEGEQRFSPGCGGEPGIVTITAGCYQPCTGATDTSCATGTSCQRTDIDPCVCGPGEACCAACGAEQWLCLAEPLGLTDLCADALSGQQLLDAVPSPIAATLTYRDDTTTELTVTTSYEGGALRCLPGFDPPPGSEAPSVPPSLEIDVAIGIVSGDGAFDESGTATLSGFVPLGSVELTARFPVASLAGTYTPTRTDATGHVVTISGSVVGTSAMGTMNEGGQLPGGVGFSEPIGSWRAE